jgi:exodeoxyribonuclease VII large subunit
MNNDLVFSVGEFVSLLNQTLEYAYPNVTITGELANFKISKNRWVYFDLKDDQATVRFFGTVYQLPGPLEDGMLLAVQGMPRLHPQYGFSVNVLNMRPMGEGSIKKAAALLEAKLAAEGLFDPARKRTLPYPPHSIGLITSAESAAYRDFCKIINARWGGLDIQLIDVQVQGESSPGQIVAAINQFNQLSVPPEVLVITRGGGSAEDLQAFSTEQVTRAVAGSRIPTLVAIGHEIDVSLGELAADVRASTPSNAAELLVPDRRSMVKELAGARTQLTQFTRQVVLDARASLTHASRLFKQSAEHAVDSARQRLNLQQQLLAAYNPTQALQRGYALVRKGEVVIRSGAQLLPGEDVQLQLSDARVTASVKHVTMKQE